MGMTDEQKAEYSVMYTVEREGPVIASVIAKRQGMDLDAVTGALDRLLARGEIYELLGNNDEPFWKKVQRDE